MALLSTAVSIAMDSEKRLELKSEQWMQWTNTTAFFD